MVLIVPVFELHQPRRLKRLFGRNIPAGAKLESAYFDDDLNREIFARVSSKAYIPALDIVSEGLEAGNFKCALSFSGVLLEQAASWKPELISKIRHMVGTGNCEIIAEPYYNSLSCLLSPEEFAAQLEMHRMAVERLFGITPMTARNTGLIAIEGVWEVMQALGFHSAIIEGSERLLGGRSPNCLYATADGKLRLLPRNYVLSDMVNFAFAFPAGSSQNASRLTPGEYLDLALSQGGEMVLISFALEAFGEFYDPESGILEFLSSLPVEASKRPGLKWETPEAAAKSLPPRGTVEARISSGCDSEKDLTAWVGNDFQRYCLENLRYLRPLVNDSVDALRVLRLFGQSDLFLYMSLKGGIDGMIHSYFSNFSSPVEAFSAFMWALSDFRARVYSMMGEDAGYYRMLYSRIPDAHAFHFHSGMCKPTGMKANNLISLMEAVQKVDEAALRFHISRGDLKRWVGEVLGNPQLAKSIGELEHAGAGGDLREALLGMVERAIEEAKRRVKSRGMEKTEAGMPH